jgi:hypothetical protein
MIRLILAGILLLSACGKQTKTKREIVLEQEDTSAVCKFYKLPNLSSMPNFKHITETATIRTDRLDNGRLSSTEVFDFLKGTTVEEFAEVNFGLVCSGEYEISSDGEYTFRLSSDDGAKLFINDVLVINHDGLHSFSTKIFKSKMTEGKIKLRVEYFQNLGEKGLQLSVVRKGSNLTEVILF